MLGRCICIVLVLSLASGNDALADGARGISQAVPEIAALEPELVGAFSARRFETGHTANGSGYY